MKKSRSILLILLSAVFALCVFAFTACTPGNDGGDGEVKITIAPTTLSLTVGGAVGNIEATVENSDETVTWSSNKPNIATVTADTENGNKAVVTPVAAGDAVITAKIGDTIQTCRVTVTGDAQQKVNVALDKAYLSLTAKGATGEVTANVTGSSETVTWAVDKPAVASIAVSGNKVTVTPLAEGTAKITATLGDITRTCTVTVAKEQKPAVTIALSKTELDLTKGADAVEVTATLTNAEAGDTVQWSLADGGDAIVTITPDGNKVSVLPIGVGDTTLTAKLGDVTEEVVITVVKAPVSLTLNKEKVELEYDPDADAATATVTATVENAENKVAWKIGSTDIATIEASDDGNTCTVTAVYAGSTVLTASVDGKTVSIPVVITPAEGVDIEVEITLSVEEEFVVLEKGKTLEISANVKGSAEMPKWSVDAEGVVELSSEEGYTIVVTAVETGDVTLTVSVGEDEDEQSVELPIGVATLTVDKTEIVLINNENDEKYTAVITATVEPTEVGVSWVVEDDEIIDIDIDDSTKILTVTAKAVGTTTITAKIGDSITREITVTVFDELTVELDEETLALEVDNAETGEATLTATVTGIDVSELVWVASKEGVVTLLDNGDGTCKVTAVAAGTVTVTVKAIRGDEQVTATCEITVAPNPDGVPEITNWTKQGDEIYGDPANIHNHVYFRDENLTITDYEVTAKINGEAATLGEHHMDAGAATGKNFHFHIQLVNATRYDDVELKFVFKNGETKVATGTYTRAGVKEVVLDRDELAIQIGMNGTVNATVNGNIADKTVTWSIADSAVASLPDTVTGNSITVTGVAEGNTTLTATVGEGDSAITATCPVTVSAGAPEPPENVKITAIHDLDHMYESAGQSIVHFYFEVPSALQGKLLKDSAEVTATINGTECDSSIFEQGGDAANVHLHIKVNTPYSTISEKAIVITVTYNNTDRLPIANLTFKKAPPDKLEVTSSINIQLVGENNDEATAEVTAEIGGSVKAEDIVWSISGDGTVATIPDDSKGISVTVTGKTAGEVKLTATYTPAGGEPMTAECTVTVVNHDVVPVEKDTFIHIEADASDIFEYHGNYFVKIQLDDSNITNTTDMTVAKFKEKFAWSQTYTVDAEGNVTDTGFGSGHNDIFVYAPAESGYAWNIFLTNAEPVNGTKYMVIGLDAQNGNKLIEVVFTYNKTNA